MTVNIVQLIDWLISHKIYGMSVSSKRSSQFSGYFTILRDIKTSPNSDLHWNLKPIWAVLPVFYVCNVRMCVLIYSLSVSKMNLSLHICNGDAVNTKICTYVLCVSVLACTKCESIEKGIWTQSVQIELSWKKLKETKCIAFPERKKGMPSVCS